MKKVFVPGLVAAIAVLAAAIVVGMLFNVIPSIKAEYENYQIFRPMNDPIMFIYFIQPFLLSFALAWVWNKAKGLFPGNLMKRTFYYALIYWFVAIVPGMIMSISSFKITVLVTLSWTISSFVQAWVASLVIIRMNK
jgi:hypothetical protein